MAGIDALDAVVEVVDFGVEDVPGVGRSRVRWRVCSRREGRRVAQGR